MTELIQRKQDYYLKHSCRPIPTTRYTLPAIRCTDKRLTQKYIVLVPQGLIVCVKAQPARITVWLLHQMPGPGTGICTGPTSGSTISNAGSIPFQSGGGARTATRSWMICGENERVSGESMVWEIPSPGYSCCR